MDDPGSRTEPKCDCKKILWSLLSCLQTFCAIVAFVGNLGFNIYWWSNLSDFGSVQERPWHLRILSIALTLTGIIVPGVTPCILGFVALSATSGEKEDIDGCYQGLLNYTEVDRSFARWMDIHCEERDCYYDFCKEPHIWNGVFVCVYLVCIVVGAVKEIVKNRCFDDKKKLE